MKKIGIDIRLIGAERTGDEAVFFHLTQEILKIDAQNEYFLFTHVSDPTELAAIQVRLGAVGKQNVTFVSLGARNRFIWNAWTLPRALARYKIDIYHTQYIAPFFLLRSVKLVTHIHDISFKVHPEWIGKKDLFFLSLLIPRSLRRSNMLLVPSEFTRQELETQYDISKEKIRVVPNACDAEWLVTLDESEKVSILGRRNIPSNYLLAIGTMQPRKNIGFLINAFERLRERDPSISLVLVGNPEGHHVDPAVRKHYREKTPGLVFPGYLSTIELKAVLQGARVFAFPSLYEGFGIPILEAFASGVPVAASHIPPSLEVAGSAALYFDPESLAEAEKALYTLYIDSAERDRLTALGKERLSHFSWPESARILHNIYEAL